MFSVAKGNICGRRSLGLPAGPRKRATLIIVKFNKFPLRNKILLVVNVTTIEISSGFYNLIQKHLNFYNPPQTSHISTTILLYDYMKASG